MAPNATTFAPDLEKGTLFIERTFDAPREAVFKAWTDPDILMQWFGPREWPLVHCTVDLQVGGVWHYCMRGPDGTESWGRGVYKEITPPSRLVYADSFSDADGNVAPGMPTMEITAEFIESDGKTILRSMTTFASPADLETVINMGMKEGLIETWDRLEEYLASK
jgi:uncharacterized protein YndB with AHSA1/START domain